MTNEHLIQLRGKANIDRPLTADKDYAIAGLVSVKQIKIHPTGDGTEDVTYVLEPTIFTIKNEAGKSVNLKKKSTLSQAMRMQIVFWMRDHFPDMDDDEAYEKMMNVILRKLDGIMTMSLKDLEV